jgi:hypothetical protein
MKKLPDYSRHRPLFSDGWNSFWHFFFGLVAIEYFYIMPGFVVYQLLTIYDRNTFLDITEFFIGYFTALFVKALSCPPRVRTTRK